MPISFDKFYKKFIIGLHEAKDVYNLDSFEEWIRDFGDDFLIFMGNGHPNKTIQKISRTARNGYDLMMKLSDEGLIPDYMSHYEMPVNPVDVEKLFLKYA